MAKNSNSYLGYGLMMMIFGLIILLSKTGVLKLIPYGSYLTTTGSFFIIAGLLLLFTKAEKIPGIVLAAIGIVLNADIFFGWTQKYTVFIIPIVLLLVGIVMVIRSK